MLTYHSPEDPEAGDINMLLILVIFFAVGTFIFGIMAISSYSRASTATKTLEAQTEKAYEKGRAEQRVLDEAEFKESNNSPFKSYSAPSLYGGFVIKYPKTWSSYAAENVTSDPQVNLFLHPDHVKSSSLGDQEGVYATRIQLRKQTTANVEKAMSRFDKKIKRSEITVSGLKAIQLVGKYEQKKSGVVVLVEVRDKTLIFICEDKKYLPEFNQILAQSIINP